MRSVGIDIGTLSVKIAEVEGSNHNFTLKDYIEVPYALDLSQDPKVQILDVLRKIATHYDPASTRFSVAVSQDLVAVRHKVFPFREKLKIMKSLPFELEDDVPFDPSNAIFDAKILRYRDKSSELLAAVCPISKVKEVLGLVQDAGIDPDVITADGFALTNLITNWDEPPSEADPLTSPSELVQIESGADGDKVMPAAELYIHMGHNKSLVILMRGASILEIRSITFGGMQIVARIQKTYDIGYAEALKGLNEKGFVLTKAEGASQDQIIFAKAISTGLDKFLVDIRKTILEAQSQFEIAVSQIHLLGGLSSLVNLAPYITQKLNVVTNVFNHLAIGFKSNVEESPELRKNSAVAIGIAIEGLKRPGNPPLNFRKGDLAKEGRSIKQFWQRWNTTAYYAAAFFGILLVYGIIKSQLASSMEAKSRTAVRKIAESHEIGIKGDSISVKRYIRDKKKENEDSKKLSHLQFINSPIDILNQISKAMPSKKEIMVDIRHFNLDYETVTLEGEVSQKIHLEQIKREMKKIAQGGKISEIATRLPPAPGKINFGLNFKVDRSPGVLE